MQNKFNLLSKLCSNTEARKIIDNLINNYNDKLKSHAQNSDEAKAIYDVYYTDLINTADKIKNDFNIDNEATYLYFSMDKYSIKKMSSKKFSNITQEIAIPVEYFKHSYWTFELNGNTMETGYYRKEDKVCELIEKNSSLFPKSTKKYIDDKIKKRNIYDIDTVDNGFKGKVLISKLPEKFRITHNRSFYKKILDNHANTKAIETFTSKYHFYKALIVKYSKEYSEQNNYVYFTNELFDDMFSQFQRVCTDEECDKVFNNIRSHEGIFNQFIQRTIDGYCNDRQLYMLYFFANDDQKIMIKPKILAVLKNNSLHGLVSFEMLSGDMKEFFFNESLRQFLIRHDNFANYIDNLKIIDKEKSLVPEA